MQLHARRSFGWIAVAAVILLSGSKAGARDREPDYQQWAQLYLVTKLPKRLLFEFDLQARRLNAPLRGVVDENGTTHYQQNPNTVLMVRPLFGYQVLPWMSAYLGYAWVPDFFDNPAVRDRSNISEHRIFEQLSLGRGYAPFHVSSRTRLEQRARSNGPGSSENDVGYSIWAHRLRQMARLAYTISDTPFMLIAWDELFIHLNRTNYPSRPGVDQNRAFVGAGYQASAALRAELGYMNLFVRRYTDPNQINHVLLLSLYLTFDARGDT
jgi:hypothetical protein